MIDEVKPTNTKLNLPPKPARFVAALGAFGGVFIYLFAFFWWTSPPHTWDGYRFTDYPNWQTGNKIAIIGLIIVTFGLVVSIAARMTSFFKRSCQSWITPLCITSATLGLILVVSGGLYASSQ